MQAAADVSAAVPTAAWDACGRLASQHGKTFYFASRFLATEQRRAIHAAYAFCRVADDIVDAAEIHGASASVDALDAWEAELTSPRHPVAVAFAATRARYDIPLEPAQDLIAGLRMDLGPRRSATWDDLLIYCYLVAGTVGVMVAPILGCRDPGALTHAAELGIAMQLTNILRDVGEDARAGRLYLPLDELAAFACDPETVLAGEPGDGFPELLSFQIERARRLYAQARRGLGALPPRSRFTVLAAGDLYAGILREIERNRYDVFTTRAHVSTTRKVRSLPGLILAFSRCSLAPASLSMDGDLANEPGHSRMFALSGAGKRAPHV